MDATTIYIGKKSTMAYVMAAALRMNGRETAEITIKARGKAISRAVDVAEIIRGKYPATAKLGGIKISTEELKAKDSDEPVKVSSIEIIISNNAQHAEGGANQEGKTEGA